MIIEPFYPAGVVTGKISFKYRRRPTLNIPHKPQWYAPLTLGLLIADARLKEAFQARKQAEERRYVSQRASSSSPSRAFAFDIVADR